MPFDTLVEKTAAILAFLRNARINRSELMALFFVVFLFGTGSAQASAASRAEAAQLCDRAAVVASRSQGVPLDVLRAITRTETGRASDRGLEPWPWTVNMEGAGRWFATEDAARSYVFSNFKAGARSFDVGCFQINYKWHGAAFRSIDEMFDPVLNAEYAARFLLQLYQELGDWTAAAGAYHSRTPELARAYAARFERIRNGVSAETGRALLAAGDAVVATTPRSRALASLRPDAPFIGGGSTSLGSLVPVADRVTVARSAFVPLN